MSTNLIHDRNGATGARTTGMPRNAARAGVALGGAALLSLGAALPAQAASDVTSGHADVVAVSSTHEVGSIYDQFGGSFSSWGSSTYDYRLVFDVAGTDVTCSNGVYTVPNNFNIEGDVPFIGFDNDSASDYEITLGLVSGPGDVAYTSSAGGLDTADGQVLTVGSGTHQHGAWAFDAGSCGGSHSFVLNFDVLEASPGTNGADRDIEFVING
ncbi:hypothetical protein APR04_004889 [Promicromonospora umidemergens]|uniref:Ribosomally synthesized peptide with SipW-like signal peptide n=1 Tax=Promicromonospora umidemergens TaxID=629679 RepID=A0ABP8WDD4_9MICO|nr:hypothetical protein [Promicromonospora umidemergens]MCP2285953.1 hypothetical protein [Promicromonospora umidemergens]